MSNEHIGAHPNVGMAVDAAGNIAYDPSKNVLDLVEAAVRCLDDMALLRSQVAETRLNALEREAGIRAEHHRNFSILRADHEKEIRELESNRLNAIRQVDVLAVNTAADRASQAIQALAATTTANAENLRNALNSTATTIANQTAATISAITERIAALEKSSYEGQGRSKFSDPMMAELLTQVKSLSEARATNTGQVSGMSALWGFLLGAVSLIATLITIAVFLTRSTEPSQPQVIYTPAVPGTMMPQPTVPVVPR